MLIEWDKGVGSKEVEEGASNVRAEHSPLPALPLHVGWGWMCGQAQQSGVQAISRALLPSLPAVIEWLALPAFPPACLPCSLHQPNACVSARMPARLPVRLLQG